MVIMVYLLGPRQNLSHWGGPEGKIYPTERNDLTKKFIASLPGSLVIMSSNEHLRVIRSLDHILGLLDNRRERFKLWWNALIGILVAIGAGIGVAVISERAELTALNEIRLIYILILILPLLALFFFSIFFEFHWIDDIEEAVVTQFYTNLMKEESSEHTHIQLLKALELTMVPVPADTLVRKLVKYQNVFLFSFIVGLIIGGLRAFPISVSELHFSWIQFLLLPALIGILRFISHLKMKSWLWEAVVPEEFLE